MRERSRAARSMDSPKLTNVDRERDSEAESGFILGGKYLLNEE